MGRSVSTPSNALHVVHAQTHSEFDEDGNFDADLTQINYDSDMENLTRELQAEFPGYTKCERWSGREDFAFLKNGRFLIGRSEYCGCLAVWIVPEPTNDDHDDDIEREDAVKLRHSLEDADMGTRLAKAVSAALGDVYAKRGCMSNGEGVFEKIEVAA
jgi:hypothetical protein